MRKNINSLYPVPLWQFVKSLSMENAETWGEKSMSWIADKLNRRQDEIFYHLSASNSSLTSYVKKNKIDISGKTAHCDVQHSIWKLNLDAGNNKCPIDPLWAENKYRFFRDGSGRGFKYIDRASFKQAVQYADELSQRPYSTTGRGTICPAKDGCFCRSLEEVRIDDWLFENGFAHEKEPNYPKHPLLNKRGLKKADWKVNEILIEYAGLLSDKSYKKRLEEKLKLAEIFQIQVIVLTQRDLNRLDEVLRPQIQ